MFRSNDVKKIFVFKIKGRKEGFVVVSDTEENARLNLPKGHEKAKLLKVRDLA